MVDVAQKVDLTELNARSIVSLPNDAFRAALSGVLQIAQTDRKENQLLYYKPAHEKAKFMHDSRADLIGVGGGNRSSKTESVLVDFMALATGVFPHVIRDSCIRKFRGPINIRIVCESLKTVLHPIILPKLKWWKWTGTDQPGGEKGHWGWVPKTCLLDGSWDRSWSEKLHTLTVLCRDPDNFDVVLGETVIQFMSYDQDPSDFASGTFHHILHDEPPPYSIWVENQARVLDVDGRLCLAMTWPDDPAIPVDWIFDEVYEKGVPGPNKDPNIDWLEYDTRDNIHLNIEATLKKAARWSKTTQGVRLQGRPIRFSNLIHPLFTDTTDWWCFKCFEKIAPEASDDGKARCPSCSTQEIGPFCHVLEFDHQPIFPVVCVIDPHPRKPHMLSYFQIDASDDIWQVAELIVEGGVEEVKHEADALEESLKLVVKLSLMDPNMGRSPSSAHNRETTWQDEFGEIGMLFELASDSDIGRGRLNEYLRPDPMTLDPRFHIHSRCNTTISQMKRYAWDDFKRTMDRDIKQTPRDKNDDFPTNIKYLMNYDPSFRVLHDGPVILKRPGIRRGMY